MYQRSNRFALQASLFMFVSAKKPVQSAGQEDQHDGGGLRHGQHDNQSKKKACQWGAT
jgi:hypothetical protein